MPVNLSIVGMGMIGKRHLQAMRHLTEVNLVALVDPIEQVRHIAEEEGVEWFSTIEEMLGVVVPDGVIISTPTEIHLEPTLSALGAGCHVLVEKPIAANLQEAKEIQETAKRVDRCVMVGHHRRYYGLMEEAQQIVFSKKLGNFLAVHGQWTSRKADEYYIPNWRQHRSSGPVLINLIHEIDILRFICGEIESITAQLQSGFREHPKEETAAIIVRFQSGVLGTFLLSDVTPSPWNWEHATGENVSFPQTGQNSYHFLCSEACLEFPNLKIWTPDGNPDWNHLMKVEERPVPLEDAYLAQCRHFCGVIRGEEEPRITAEDASKTLAATLAVFESAEEQRTIAL
jgi:predicted dehydrogenase